MYTVVSWVYVTKTPSPSSSIADYTAYVPVSWSQIRSVSSSTPSFSIGPTLLKSVTTPTTSPIRNTASAPVFSSTPIPDQSSSPAATVSSSSSQSSKVSIGIPIAVFTILLITLCGALTYYFLFPRRRSRHTEENDGPWNPYGVDASPNKPSSLAGRLSWLSIKELDGNWRKSAKELDGAHWIRELQTGV